MKPSGKLYPGFRFAKGLKACPIPTKETKKRLRKKKHVPGTTQAWRRDFDRMVERGSRETASTAMARTRLAKTKTQLMGARRAARRR
jgi:hypothetical protein